MFLQYWFLPTLVLLTASVIAFPLSNYLVFIMDGKYKPLPVFKWFEKKLDNGGQDWKQYTKAMLIFNTGLFAFGYLVLSLQPLMPWNPDGKGMLSPTTIFHSAVSFMTNTDLQHYSGEVHLSTFTQTFFGFANFFMSASIGLCALTAIIRALRSDGKLGNFFLDMWRVVVYAFIPFALAFGLFFLIEGCPMTFNSSYHASTLEPASMGTDSTGAAKKQAIVVGPIAAWEAMKMLGTNGGGYYGMNSAHPFENPTDLANFFNTVAMMIFPFALVFMYGKMLNRKKHGLVIFAVMLFMMIGTIVWSIYYDTTKPNPAFTVNPETRTYTIPSATAPGGTQNITLPSVAGLPVDQHLGNLEGKELRFGTAAGATYAAITVDVTAGAVNSEHDSLNPMASISPMVGMWLNCIFGGKGVGMINMLLFIIIGIFIAGMMVGRSPEYLGKKIGAREMKLATIALLIHPLMILFPTGLFAATAWGLKAISNPGMHGFSQIFYQFSSASANNGSAFDGLGVTYGFANNPVSPTAAAWDIAAGIVIIISRFLPIVAPIAMAGILGQKKSSPFGLGTLRTDSVTFGVLLFATIMIIGALLFLPIAVLGPVAEHFGPIPFGG
ncbi:MAG: potassium-transporting ATPase subunit KdpA [Ignavibacteriaceae bacterium]